MVAELVGQARRRYLWNEILAQGAWAVSAGLAALILLLVLGAQILDWRWLVALPLATFLLGAWLTIRRLPSAYLVAQLVDHRLGLADSLSTALFYETGGESRMASEGVLAAQKAQAERLSARLDARNAIPFTMPRAIYSVAILGVAASSLFALRYGLEEGLDLRRPLASVIQQAFGLDERQLAALDREKPQPPGRKPPPFQNMQGLALNDAQFPMDGRFQGEALDASGAPATPEQARQLAQRAAAQEGSEQGDQSGEGDEFSGINVGGDEKGQEGQQGGEQDGQGKGPQDREGGDNSLLAKFRDAMQNLMSRMRQPPGAQGGNQQNARQQNSRDGKSQPGEGQESGQQGEQQSAGQQGEGQEGQPGAEAQSSQSASNQGSGQSGQENPSQQPGSGMGRQDGKKDIEDAEQLAAMGKLSEIIGKRSANLTGEVTVEVQSSHQQLQTPYSQRRATQGEAVSEISRDEVPVALENYVQQYFEQVRKTPGSAARR
jgi:hypothetical protein